MIAKPLCTLIDMYDAYVWICNWFLLLAVMYMQNAAVRALVVEDKTLVCQGCGLPFLFTVNEQGFFASKDLKNEPKRCLDCRNIQKLLRNGLSPDIMTKVNCAECGSACTVPFVPKGHRPVYCNRCMHMLNLNRPKFLKTVVNDNVDFGAKENK